MENEETQTIREIKESMAEGARPAFDERDIEHLGNLIRVTVQFYYFLTSRGRWPVVPDDPFHNLTYAVDSVLFNIDSYRAVTRDYGSLVAAKKTTIDWSAVAANSLRGQFLAKYQDFVAEANFESKCRLLLDLFKLEIVFAGMFYDCHPQTTAGEEVGIF